MKNNDFYSPRSTWVEGFILTRAEGRADDKYWPVGRTMVRESLREFDYYLHLAASKLEHEGYDKFDLTAIYSDGERRCMGFGLDREFITLREHFPTLFR